MLDVLQHTFLSVLVSHHQPLGIFTFACGCFFKAFNGILLQNLSQTLLCEPVKPNHPCNVDSVPLDPHQASTNPREAALAMILLGPLFPEEALGVTCDSVGACVLPWAL